jgi:putative peptidoglycan lipid II flippase
MKLYRSIATVGGYTAVSRVLGFLRDVLTARVIGAGAIADAFFVAFRLPNLFRSLFAEGAFNSAFVPLFTKCLNADGKTGARVFAEEALAVLLTVLIIVTAIAEIAMPLLIRLMAPGFKEFADVFPVVEIAGIGVPGLISQAMRESADKYDLTVLLTRITFPYLLCMSLTALVAGILNALGRFVAAAAAPILLNVTLSSALLIALAFGTKEHPSAVILSWGVFVAGFVQLAFLVAGAKRQEMGLGFRLPRLTPSIRRLFWLAVPGVVTAGITQINLFIGTMIASHSESAVSYLYYADRINQLPLGIVGIAIGVVLLPELTQKLNGEDPAAAFNSHNRSMEFALILTIPAAVALIVVPLPIIQVLFEHGKFSAQNSNAVAMTLAAFAMGLPASVLIRVFLPGFFAREDTRTPMIFAGISAAVNIGGSLALFPLWGHVGIAAATTMAAWTNAVLLGGTLLVRGHFRPDTVLRHRGPMILLASVIMGGALWLAYGQLAFFFTPNYWIVWRILILGVLVGFGGIVYLVATQLTGAINYRSLLRILVRG